MSDERIGRVIGGRYEIMERIASGGMGVVFRAQRVGLGRAVAIKFLHPWIAENPVTMKRFEVEAMAASKLTHANTTPVIDFGVEAGAPYVVMEHVVGRPLRALIEAGPTPAPRAVGIVRQILAGLGHAHTRGIVHRDVKPDNVVLAEETGVGDHVRVLDFGLAKLEGQGTLTTGYAMGTPAYMAPEQTLGEPVDARTDLYAVGVLLYELIAGKKPFIAKDAPELFKLHRTAEPPKLPGVSAPLDELVRKALAKKPEARWQTAAEMAAALETVPEVAAAAPTPTVAPPPRRTTPAVVALAAGLVLLAVGGGWLASRWRRTAPAAVATPAADAGELDDAVNIEVDPKAVGVAHESTPRLIELRRKDPSNAEVAFALGHRYFSRLWWQDGMQAYQAAVRLDPKLRKDPTLIRDLVRSLVSDTFHGRAEAFLRAEVGAEALPYLDAAAATESLGMRNRARALAAELRARP